MTSKLHEQMTLMMVLKENRELLQGEMAEEDFVRDAKILSLETNW